MVVFDANVILRIILNDNEFMVNNAKAVIKSRQVLIKNEVLAEVVYVLTKVYKVNKFEICENIFKIDNSEKYKFRIKGYCYFRR